MMYPPVTFSNHSVAVRPHVREKLWRHVCMFCAIQRNKINIVYEKLPTCDFISLSSLAPADIEASLSPAASFVSVVSPHSSSRNTRSIFDSPRGGWRPTPCARGAGRLESTSSSSTMSSGDRLAAAAGGGCDFSSFSSFSSTRPWLKSGEESLKIATGTLEDKHFFHTIPTRRHNTPGEVRPFPRVYGQPRKVAVRYLEGG